MIDRIEETIKLITGHPEKGFKWMREMEKKGYTISGWELGGERRLINDGRSLEIIAEKTKPFKHGKS